MAVFPSEPKRRIEKTEQRVAVALGDGFGLPFLLFLKDSAFFEEFASGGLGGKECAFSQGVTGQYHMVLAARGAGVPMEVWIELNRLFLSGMQRK